MEQLVSLSIILLGNLTATSPGFAHLDALWDFSKNPSLSSEKER